MAPTAEQWIVKDERGRIYGPFSTERLMTLIERSVFTGEEQIAQYPNGSFKGISRVPKFYDRLLDVLANEAKPLTASQRHNELTQNESAKEPPPVINRAVRENAHKETVDSSPEQTKPVSRQFDKTSQPVIELKKQEEIEKVDQLKKVLIASLIICAGGIAYMFLSSEPTSAPAPEGLIELQYPKTKRESIDEAAAKNQLVLATKLFQLDNFSNYYKAMNILVNLIESGYSNVDAYSLLCLTHRELWPFANQDSKDLMAISKVTQLTSQKDPVGLSSATCRVVQYFLGGQSEGATTLTDSTLSAHPSAAAFYEFKSALLASRGESLAAIGYLEKAEQLWPRWLKIKNEKAKLLFKANRANESASLFREVISQNTAHASAKINLGFIEYFNFNNAQVGVELTRTGLDTDRVSRDQSSRAYLLLAVQSEQIQKVSEAISFANQAFSLDPTNVAAKAVLQRLGGQEQLEGTTADRELVALGEEYIKKGNYFAAQAEFKSAFEMNPKNGRAALLAGQSLWELNQSLEAIDWVKKAIQADKGLINAYVLLADYHSKRFDFKSANQALQEAQKVSPQSYQVISGYALVELRRRNFKGAADLAKRALKLYDTDIDTQMILAMSFQGQNDYKSAFETISKAVSLDTNNRKAQILYAEILSGYHGVSAAVEYLKNLSNTFPQQSEYKIALARVLIKDDQIKPGIETLTQAIAANDKNKDAYILLGRAQEKNSDLRAALKAYLSASALDPADVQPGFLAGELYLKMNDFQKAIAQFEQVVKINPQYPSVHYQLGRAALLMGNAERALQEAALEKRMNPSLSEGYILSGDVYLSKREFSKAAAEYQKAVALQPQASTYTSLARAYRLQENYNVASRLLAKAIALEDGNPEVYKEQGAIFEGRGERAEAVLAYQKYLQLLPNAPDRQIIETRIRGLGGRP